MIGKIPVSVYVLTFNNRRTIERCLKSLAWAEELVVVDSFSTDGTYEICQRYTDKSLSEEVDGPPGPVPVCSRPDHKRLDHVCRCRRGDSSGACGRDSGGIEGRGGRDRRLFRLPEDLLPREMDPLRRMVSGWRDSSLPERKGEMGGRTPCQDSRGRRSQIPQEPVSPLYLSEYLRSDPDDRQIFADCSGGHGPRGGTVQPLQTPFSSSVSMSSRSIS